MEAKAQALCGDERLTEMGAVLPRLLASSRLGVLYGTLTLDLGNIVVFLSSLDDDNNNNNNAQTAKLTKKEYVGLLASKVAEPGQSTTSVVGTALQAFLATVERYPELKSFRIDGSGPALAKLTTDLAVENGFGLLIDALRPMTVGYGYGYYLTASSL